MEQIAEDKYYQEIITAMKDVIYISKLHTDDHLAGFWAGLGREYLSLLKMFQSSWMVTKYSCPKASK